MTSLSYDEWPDYGDEHYISWEFCLIPNCEDLAQPHGEPYDELCLHHARQAHEADEADRRYKEQRGE